MSIHLDGPSIAGASVQDQQGVGGWDDWDLDVSIVESGVAAEQLIRMTDDGCGSTCQSACTSCP
ncbi:FxLD family lanthipeptide [Nonomuraea sp. NPDC049649]|uniref:FxLD family lanthipeptide n=1 Tax=Nonomuraea sp. NPDC049649 TaxID=3155776 RepID=UPI003430BDDB